MPRVPDQEDEAYDPYRLAAEQDAAVDAAELPPVPDPVAPVDPVLPSETPVADAVPELAQPAPAPTPEPEPAPSLRDQFVSFLKRGLKAPETPAEVARADNVSEALYSAFTRRPVSPGNFGRSTQAALQTQQLEAAKVKATTPTAAKAALTPADVAAQNAFIGAVPDLAKRMGVEAVRGMTADQLKAYLTFGSGEAQRQLRDDLAEKDLGFKKERAAANDGFRKEALKNAALRIELQKQQTAGVESRYQRTAFKSDYLDKIHPVRPALAALANINEDFPEFVQGSSELVKEHLNDPRRPIGDLLDRAAMLGTRLKGPELNKLQQEFALLKYSIARPEVGANFTGIEKEIWDTILPGASLGDPKAMAIGVALMRKKLARTLHDMESGARARMGSGVIQGVDPEAPWKEYDAAGGWSARHPLFAGALETPVAIGPEVQAPTETAAAELVEKATAPIRAVVKPRLQPPPDQTPPDPVVETRRTADGRTLLRRRSGKLEIK